MNIVLLSGGSGKRLWPLSNDIRSKQFIKMFDNENGSSESMLQRVYRQIKEADGKANVVITTGKKQVGIIKNQIGDNVSVCVEPSRRDTFPAILLAAAYLKYECGICEEESVAVCPIDPYVNQDYFETVKELYEESKKGVYNLYLMGVVPTYPSEKYGYLIPKTKGRISTVREFKEKPNLVGAKDYIKDGGLWNCGVFVFKLRYMLDIGKKFLKFVDFNDLYENYEILPKKSFDYIVSEKENSICCIRFSGQWKDIGSWNTFSESMSKKVIGDVRIDDATKNTNVVNELDIPILCMGCRNMIVAASNDGILVSDKAESSYIKPYVEEINGEIRYAEKSWGSYKVVDVNENSLIIKVTLMPGHKMFYHSHNRRDEIWNVVSGNGKVIVDGQTKDVARGDVITINCRAKHTVIAENKLIMIEIQLGEDISADDKTKYKI